MKKFIALISILLICPVVFAQVFHVSVDGSDSGSGEDSSPWLSPAAALCKIRDYMSSILERTSPIYFIQRSSQPKNSRCHRRAF